MPKAGSTVGDPPGGPGSSPPEAGKARAIGLSNASREQLERFAAVCPLAACQLHFNMLQREIEREILPWCTAKRVAMVVYWPLMKGLLAGTDAEDPARVEALLSFR